MVYLTDSRLFVDPYVYEKQERINKAFRATTDAGQFLVLEDYRVDLGAKHLAASNSTVNRSCTASQLFDFLVYSYNWTNRW